MARKRTQAKPTETDAENSPPPVHAMIGQTQTIRRRNPAWHRQYFRRLAIHGNKTRAAKECKIDYRQVLRMERLKPRFRRAVSAALKIAEERYEAELERTVEDIALNGLEEKVFKNGTYVGSFTKYFPALTRHVLDTVVRKYRARADAKDKARGLAQGSVSNTVNTLNVSLTHASADNPTVRALLLALSDELTRSRAESPILSVTDACEPPATPSDDAPIVVRSDDE